MDNQIALSDIKDVTTLKSYAFDCIQRIEVEQRNLQALQARIAQLNEVTETPKKG